MRHFILLMAVAALIITGCEQSSKPETKTSTAGTKSETTLIPQNNWRLVHVDSEDTIYHYGINAFDGKPDTFWHTEFRSSKPAHPHEIQIDLGATYELDSFRYLPRQDGVWGRIKDYAFYVSNDTKNWGDPVASGSFVNSADEQTVVFNSRALGRYIRLVALNEVEGRPTACVAEINVMGNLNTSTSDLIRFSVDGKNLKAWNTKNKNNNISRHPQGVLMRSTVADAQNIEATQGVYTEISTEFKKAFLGQPVIVIVVARQADKNGTEKFAVAYSASEVGNSGWQHFDVTSTFKGYSFEFNVPAINKGL